MRKIHSCHLSLLSKSVYCYNSLLPCSPKLWNMKVFGKCSYPQKTHWPLRPPSFFHIGMSQRSLKNKQTKKKHHHIFCRFQLYLFLKKYIYIKVCCHMEMFLPTSASYFPFWTIDSIHKIMLVAHLYSTDLLNYFEYVPDIYNTRNIWKWFGQRINTALDRIFSLCNISCKIIPTLLIWRVHCVKLARTVVTGPKNRNLVTCRLLEEEK